MEINKGVGNYFPEGGNSDAISRGANPGEYAGNPLIDENMKSARDNYTLKNKSKKGKKGIDSIIDENEEQDKFK